MTTTIKMEKQTRYWGNPRTRILHTRKCGHDGTGSKVPFKSVTAAKPGGYRLCKIGFPDDGE